MLFTSYIGNERLTTAIACALQCLFGFLSCLRAVAIICDRNGIERAAYTFVKSAHNLNEAMRQVYLQAVAAETSRWLRHNH